MFNVFFYVAFTLVFLVVFMVMAIRRNKPERIALSRVFVVIWMVMYFVNLFLPDSFVSRTFDDVSKYLSGENIWFAIVRWANDVAFIVLPVAYFCKGGKKTINRIVAYFLLLACVINVAAFYKYIELYTNESLYLMNGGTEFAGGGIASLRFLSAEQRAIFFNRDFRAGYFFFMFLLEISLILYKTCKNLGDLKIENAKEAFDFVGVLLLVIFSALPIYVPQYLFKGYELSTVSSFYTMSFGKPFHLIWIGFIVVECVILALVFGKKSKEVKFAVVTVMAFSLLIQYNQMFTGIGEITAHRMPFQLCNMAPLFILMMLILKSDTVYHFTLVVNAVGAFIAVIMCDTSPFGITYIMSIHYIAEHTNIILIPVLCAIFGLFRPLEKKHIKHVIIGFIIYFTVVLLVGTYFKYLLTSTGSDYWNANYFFMFDVDAAVKLLPGALGTFAKTMFGIKFTLFGKFEFTLIQPIILAVFLVICILFFFIFYAIFRKRRSADE